MKRLWVRLTAVGVTTALGGAGVYQMLPSQTETPSIEEPQVVVAAEPVGTAQPIPFEAEGPATMQTSFTEENTLRRPSEFKVPSPKDTVVRGNDGHDAERGESSEVVTVPVESPIPAESFSPSGVHASLGDSENASEQEAQASPSPIPTFSNAPPAETEQASPAASPPAPTFSTPPTGSFGPPDGTSNNNGFPAPSANLQFQAPAASPQAAPQQDSFQFNAPPQQPVTAAPATQTAPAFSTNRGALENERFASNVLPAAASSVAGPGVGTPGDRSLEGEQSPSIALQKLAPDEIQVGKQATFEILVRNVGQTPAHDVTVEDQIPKGTRLIDTTPPHQTAANGSLLWQLGTIQPGEETTIQLNVMPEAEGEIGSVATVSFQAHASVRTLCTRPALDVAVSATPKVLVGEYVKFAIRISNPGTGAATGVTIEEDVPEGLVHEAGRELEFEVGTLLPGETRELELILLADKAGVAQNELVVRGDANLSVQEQVTVEVIAPDLQVDMTGPKLRYLDREATYTLSVANPGTATAKNIELSTFLPKGLKFVSTENQGQYDSRSHAIYWTLDQLPAGQNAEVQLSVLPVETGEQKLQVRGIADLGIERQIEKAVIVDSLAELFFNIQDLSDPIEVGAATVYQVTVTNTGSKTATNVRLGALLPPALRPTGGDGPTRAAVNGQQVIFDTLARLAPKSEVTYKISAQGLRAGDSRIQVQLISDESPEPVTKEESTRVYSDK